VRLVIGVASTKVGLFIDSFCNGLSSFFTISILMS
jgi:hypothetical protein